MPWRSLFLLRRGVKVAHPNSLPYKNRTAFLIVEPDGSRRPAKPEDLVPVTKHSRPIEGRAH